MTLGPQLMTKFNELRDMLQTLNDEYTAHHLAYSSGWVFAMHFLSMMHQ